MKEPLQPEAASFEPAGTGTSHLPRFGHGVPVGSPWTPVYRPPAPAANAFSAAWGREPALPTSSAPVAASAAAADRVPDQVYAAGQFSSDYVPWEHQLGHTQSQAHREPTVPYPGFDYPPPNNPSTGSHPLRPDVNPFPPGMDSHCHQGVRAACPPAAAQQTFPPSWGHDDCPPAFRLVPGMA